MRVPALKKLLRERDLSVSGRKADLIERLREADTGASGEEASTEEEEKKEEAAKEEKEEEEEEEVEDKRYRSKWVDLDCAEVALPVDSASKGDKELTLGTWRLSVSWFFAAEPSGDLEEAKFGRLWIKPRRAKKVKSENEPADHHLHQRVIIRSMRAPGTLTSTLPLGPDPHGGDGWHCFPLHSFVKSPVCRFEVRASKADLPVAVAGTLLLPFLEPETYKEDWEEVDIPLVQESSLQPQSIALEDAGNAAGTLTLKYKWTRPKEDINEEEEPRLENPDACVGELLLKSVQTTGVKLHTPTLRVAVSCSPPSVMRGYAFTEHRIGLGHRQYGGWSWDIPEKAGLFEVDLRKTLVDVDQVVSLRQYFAMASALSTDAMVESMAARFQYFYWTTSRLLRTIAWRESLWRKTVARSHAANRAERYAVFVSGVCVAALLASLTFREDCGDVPPPAACIEGPHVAGAFIASVWGTAAAYPVKKLIYYCFWRRTHLNKLDDEQKRQLVRKQTFESVFGWLLSVLIYAFSAVLGLTYVIHYSWEMVHSWTYAFGFCIIHPALLVSVVRTAWAFCLLTASRYTSACDGLLLMSPWTSDFNERVPVSMPQLGANWRRLRAKRRWGRVRILVLTGMLKLTVMNAERRGSQMSATSSAGLNSADVLAFAPGDHKNR